MKIRHLEIKNFRGISEFSQKINKDFVCLVGRGDSCKTTILEAISLALSPSWNPSFYDTDFYKSNIEESIEISVSISELPEELLIESKYGLHKRGLDKNGDIIDDLSSAGEEILTIKLIVDKTLEPKWLVVNNRPYDEDKKISAGDRAKLNCFIVSDYVDRHFSWNKGSPLYSMLQLEKTLLGDSGDEDKNIVMEAVRGAKLHVDENNDFSTPSFSNVSDRVTEKAADLGLDLSDTKTTIDFRDIFIKDGRVCLHDEQNIPFRLKGKGSKRLASIAIQLVLAQNGGIVMIDEIEQGLEPDRIKQLARSLRDDSNGQIFITTHSRDVITELGSEGLLVIRRDKDSGKTEAFPLDYNEDKLRGVIRACPEAFFAKKVIVCEGATEVGICRALDKYRKEKGKNLMSFNDCVYIDGTGRTFFEWSEDLLDVEFKVSILCDSDINDKSGKKITEDQKNKLKESGAEIFDCEDEKAIEQQVFSDLPWEAVIEIVDDALKIQYKCDEEAMNNSIKAKCEGSLPENWKEVDCKKVRNALAVTSGKRVWFKGIAKGEALGTIIFKNFDKIEEGKHLKIMLQSLINWIDEK